jgi:hypothetical protein
MIARAVATVAALCLFGTSADALTMKECSAKYKAAQTANTLNGQKWKDFRKAECGVDASVKTTAAPTAPPLAAPAAPAPKAARAPTGAPPKPLAPPAMPPAAGSAMFPDAISPKYSTESPGKARMHTCLDQYNANKTNNGNGGLKWIVKGGGYYSECNKQLKG